MKNRDLGYAHLGSGLSVYDRSEIDPEIKDYKKVAHISPYRKVTYYTEVSDKDRLSIESTAAFDDSRVSTSQLFKTVFRTPPLDRFDKSKCQIIINHHQSGPVYIGTTIDGIPMTLDHSTYQDTARALIDQTRTYKDQLDIYYYTTDDQNGTNTYLFDTKEERDQAANAWIRNTAKEGYFIDDFMPSIKDTKTLYSYYEELVSQDDYLFLGQQSVLMSRNNINKNTKPADLTNSEHLENSNPSLETLGA